MLGLNHNVKNVPVNNKTTKLHNAISPNMNDQWSGNTFRICFLLTAARPVRSSTQAATRAGAPSVGTTAARRPARVGTSAAIDSLTASRHGEQVRCVIL